MKAVIMAGGKGTRLRPLTCNLPKPMMPVMNRPLMLYTIYLLKEHKVTDIAVTVQYLPWVIQDYFGGGEDLGVKLCYYEETIPLGTAGGVRNAAEFLDETFIVISGDALTDFDLGKALDFHRQKGGFCTMVLTRREYPLEFGVCILDDNSRLIRYLEKPCWGEVFSDTVNTGIYILEPEAFALYPPGTFYDFSKDLFPLMLREDVPIYGYIAEGYWSDIGDLGQYRQTHLDILQGKIKVPLPGEEIKPGVWVGNNTHIGPRVEIEGPALIGDYCHLKEGVVVGEYTVLGSDNQLERGATLKRTVAWDRNYIGPMAELRGTLVGNQCTIKNRVTLLEGSVISDQCILGSNTTIRPEVKLWPKKTIGDNTTVSQSIIWQEGASRRFFGHSGIRGIPNGEMTPEFIVRLAAAYGTVLEKGTEIVVSSDRDSFAQVLKRAFCAGLLSTGVNAVDIGTATTAVNRYGVKVLKAQGGAHLRVVEEDDSPLLAIEFLDSSGITQDRNWERKVENTLQQEEFRRASFQQVGEQKYLPQLSDAYVERLTRTVQKDVVRRRHLRVVITYDHENLSFLITPLLEKLGCQVIVVSLSRQAGQPSLQEGGGLTREQALEALAKSTRAGNADLGVYIDRNGEDLTLFTGEGESLAPEIKTALLVKAVLSSPAHKAAAVPVSAPGFIEKMVEGLSGNAIRTALDSRSIMEVTRDSFFQLHYDALYALVILMDYLAREETDLARMARELPAFFMERKTVPTRWGDIGKVMRRLMEETRGQQVEMIDGIKVFHPGGWTLVVPDADESVFRIISEGCSAEEASSQASRYARWIRELQDNG